MDAFYLVVMPKHRKPKVAHRSELDFYLREAREVYEVPALDLHGNRMTAEKARRAIAAGMILETGIMVLKHPSMVTVAEYRGSLDRVPEPNMEILRHWWKPLGPHEAATGGGQFWSEVRRLSPLAGPDKVSWEGIHRAVLEVTGQDYTLEEVKVLVSGKMLEGSPVHQKGMHLPVLPGEGRPLSAVDLARTRGITFGTTQPHSPVADWVVSYEVVGFAGIPMVMVRLYAKAAGDVVPMARSYALAYAEVHGMGLSFVPGARRGRDTTFTDQAGKKRRGNEWEIMFEVLSGRPKYASLAPPPWRIGEVPGEKQRKAKQQQERTRQRKRKEEERAAAYIEEHHLPFRLGDTVFYHGVAVGHYWEPPRESPLTITGAYTLAEFGPRYWVAEQGKEEGHRWAVAPSDLTRLPISNPLPCGNVGSLPIHAWVDILGIDARPPHRIKDEAKVRRLVRSILKQGWVGRPLLLMKKEGCTYALTGVHRVAAIRRIQALSRKRGSPGPGEIFVPVVFASPGISWEWRDYDDLMLEIIAVGDDEAEKILVAQMRANEEEAAKRKKRKR